MGLQSISFTGLLGCWAVGLLLGLGLDRLHKFDLLRPRSVLPLALVPALLWLLPLLPHLVEQCQLALAGTMPGQFLEHTFHLLQS